MEQERLCRGNVVDLPNGVSSVVIDLTQRNVGVYFGPHLAAFHADPSGRGGQTTGLSKALGSEGSGREIAPLRDLFGGGHYLAHVGLTRHASEVAVVLQTAPGALPGAGAAAIRAEQGDVSAVVSASREVARALAQTPFLTALEIDVGAGIIEPGQPHRGAQHGLFSLIVSVARRNLFVRHVHEQGIYLFGISPEEEGITQALRDALDRTEPISRDAASKWDAVGRPAIDFAKPLRQIAILWCQVRRSSTWRFAAVFDRSDNGGNFDQIVYRAAQVLPDLTNAICGVQVVRGELGYETGGGG